ncbi:hypothetical protein [Streptomyces sp. NPDC127108]|uniref:hypothetical protein n=1 Tax=Streptomyces sp. NPDC127108 TaxID=3345361 RepID=UPI00363BA737
MRTLLATATALLTVALTTAPTQAVEARQQPTAPSPAQHRAAAPFHFDIWFNGYGYSPKADRPQGNRQRVSFSASCDGDIVAGQLYHVTWGRDRPVGNVVRIPCNRTASAIYELSGGEYYFFFLSGVNNTHVVGDWA